MPLATPNAATLSPQSDYLNRQLIKCSSPPDEWFILGSRNECSAVLHVALRGEKFTLRPLAIHQDMTGQLVI